MGRLPLESYPGRKQLNRSASSPASNLVGLDCDELKELFPDPVLRKKSDHGQKTASERSNSQTSSCKEEDKTTSVDVPIKVEDPGFTVAGSSLMTKRITIAGGFLDIALFTNNCEQLKFVLELGAFHIYYNHVLGLLITSLVLQLLVGFTMFLMGYQIVQKASHEQYLNVLNYITMGLVAAITIINIFIGTFGPKATLITRCFGAFTYANISSSMWIPFLNETRNYTVSNG